MADQWLLEHLSATEQGASLIVEDWRATPTSPFLVGDAMPTLFHGAEVYYMLNANAIRSHPLWRKILSNTVPSFHAFVLRTANQTQAGSDAETPSLELLASAVRMVICGAYDGEGYVLGTV